MNSASNPSGWALNPQEAAQAQPKSASSERGATARKPSLWRLQSSRQSASGLDPETVHTYSRISRKLIATASAVLITSTMIVAIGSIASVP